VRVACPAAVAYDQQHLCRQMSLPCVHVHALTTDFLTSCWVCCCRVVCGVTAALCPAPAKVALLSRLCSSCLQIWAVQMLLTAAAAHQHATMPSQCANSKPLKFLLV
jgi:hypothetical protein